MNINHVNHNALTHLVEAGAVNEVIVKAVGDTWALSVKVGDTLKIVMAKNSGKPRIWRKLDTVAKYLKELGVESFEINVSRYDPSKKSLRRPDSANTLKQTHKSHQALQQQEADLSNPTDSQQPQLIVTTRDSQSTAEYDSHEVTEPVKQNNTDKAIELAKNRWEERRAKILQEENPRAK